MPPLPLHSSTHTVEPAPTTPKLPETTYVVEPSLFTVEAASTTIGEARGGDGLARQRRSNERHRAPTRALWGGAEEEEAA